MYTYIIARIIVTSRPLVALPQKITKILIDFMDLKLNFSNYFCSYHPILMLAV